jgi:cell division protein FtsI (penicillin-binding protein 3)
MAGEDGMRARQNLAVSRTFEPGSVFKVITLAAGLEKTSLTPESMIDCGNGQLNLFGRVIHDHDAYRSLTMAGVLAHSSNIGAIRIALATGNQNFYEYEKRFGFGTKTGLPLPGESSGILWPVEKWTKSSIGSMAMGHEIGVTSMQLARAGAVVANGGMLVKPRLVLSRQRAGKEKEVFAAVPGERVLQPETAIQMRRMMEGVVLEGTGRKAVLQGYTSAGKTGSAQIYDPKTHTYSHSYNASFLGFAPVGNPRVVIAVTLHGTKGGSAGYGGARAAPVFREVAMSALRILDVPKDLPDAVVRASTVKEENDLAAAGPDDGAVAVTAARQARLESQRLETKNAKQPNDLSPELARGTNAARSKEQSGRDTRSSNDTSGSETRPLNDITQDETVLRARAVSSVTLPLARGGAPVNGDSTAGQRPFFDAGPGLAVPNFHGMTKRAVLEESLAAGLRVEIFGDGLAANQDPPPGANLRPGMAVKVQLGR